MNPAQEPTDLVGLPNQAVRTWHARVPRVQHTGIVVVAVDPVRSKAAVELINRAVAPTINEVVATSCIYEIGSFVRPDDVAAIPASDRVVASTTVDGVGPVRTPDEVVTTLAVRDPPAVGPVALVAAVAKQIEMHDLPWQPVFNGGFVSFRRPGGYKVVVVDMYWNGPVRLAITLPAEPEQLGLVNPYPELESRWSPADKEWGWVIKSIDKIPDVGPAIDIARAYTPESGPLVKPT
jgi:hypothetical protein